jgi:hypothetical protein
MFGRSSTVIPFVLFVSLLGLLLSAGPAYAHRLDAEVFLRPDRQVQVESWFSNGEKPTGAKVQVLKANGQLLTEGQLDDRGVFVFNLEEVEPFRVVVSAGAGHRKEVSISAQALKEAFSKGEEKTLHSSSGAGEAPAILLSGSRSDISVKDVLVGVSFLLALAAFVLSLRNARQLRELKKSTRSPSAPR